MTISEALKKNKHIEIELLLQAVLKKPKEFLFMSPEYKLSPIQQVKLMRMIKRRESGEPVAYILGHKDFYGLPFMVNKQVLIPRPETEWIVERISNFNPQVGGQISNKPMHMLDVGTGSGCVIISIAHELASTSLKTSHKKKIHYTASDISPQALATAKKNAIKILGKNSNTSEYWSFVRSDLFEKISGKFNVIVANLPYVPKTDLKLRRKEYKGLRHEPQLALSDGTDNFQVYEKFLQQVERHLKPTFQIYFEMDPKTKPFIQKWVKKYLPQAKVTFHKDLNHLWRFAVIKNSK